ncbi:amidase signature domain-containing protein [Tuber borchii]|uniref:Amidase signature domain-containing protein n=1 Tax=Tuber borchii TaxID=42251 RepID=A0A2T6ZI86_TUBBO|nr:amidase signature domain-containing protein [Tuber borchii]
MEALPKNITIEAKPYSFTFPLSSTALLLIDLQRDFILPSGFGDIQSGTNLTEVTAVVPNCVRILQAFRELELPIFHTREGHLPDLSDCPSSKLNRQASAPGTNHSKVIGDPGELGRLLVRGEYGHDIVDECRPKRGEIVMDKPGKGAFWNTNLLEELVGWGITHLIVGGVTTECCVTTTVREANDRGFECCIIEECTAGYNNSFKAPSLNMIHWSQGLFGFVSTLPTLLKALAPALPSPSVPAPDLDFESPPSTPPMWDGRLTLASLRNSYKSGLSPVTVITSLYTRIDEYSQAKSIFIRLVDQSASISYAESLQKRFPDLTNLPPLYGVPFTLKDSINVAGIPTTLACPPLIHIPSLSSKIYSRLISLGAIYIGKTNLDQFATGLTGCRSPYGIPASVYNPDYVSGGSSSGAAVSVGAELASFAIATDTAGSGRVPAGFNGVVGWKPTKGTVSFSGVMNACESLDCLSFMVTPEGGVKDAQKLWNLVRGYDPDDPYSKTPGSLPLPIVNALGEKKWKFALPDRKAVAECSPEYRKLFYQAIGSLHEIGGEVKEGDWGLFEEAGKLLYDGALVNERLAALPDDRWVEREKDELHPVIREIFQNALEKGVSAAEAYKDLRKMTGLTRKVNTTLFNPSHPSYIDVLIVPTAPFHPRISAVLKDPIAINSRLGTFTHFGNVLDLCAIAVPAGHYMEEEKKMPFSITFLGRGGSDARVLEIASLFEGLVGVGARDLV